MNGMEAFTNISKKITWIWNTINWWQTTNIKVMFTHSMRGNISIGVFKKMLRDGFLKIELVSSIEYNRISWKYRNTFGSLRIDINVILLQQEIMIIVCSIKVDSSTIEWIKWIILRHQQSKRDC